MITSPIIANRINGEVKAIGRVRLFPLQLLNQLTLDIDILHVYAHAHS